ncbi:MULTISPECIES: CaiB/BaiF CoA transferase family protein [unclassified Sphingobium]|uniref:CaiB/BaiF CoA transferase family protein n=1 Tax=unclassified Sphingobium TaxID=2611147 RepID=UPI000D15A315|nr:MULTISPECIES: CaiB/BaiF CoA-transferase family protein [unclassified Sphingobium]MBG6120116.1 crotonobetainyl-CoA:carnitine CoA-transferase CaiB-like acyl-CoA transferase [Sphingobium sp. JAI105]PSO12841.1 CoA transferase [Sphingobium sp. AEW4]TWD05683.1 crotonobetainyl-CoA:carnitine CoA-transferase CaiB-like acyl-CoA transferase [Sphingobium sp. AEW010]TWD23236.1 crotonobetainyl-CoA:carnitine CoA-transferase CaiB-like acyl-CoA transferase [Sphingobium sp. AEW013]TWD25096.1 crotonobetainyl-
MADLPLSNIRVLDLTRVLAGPLAAQMLGDLGAEVLKIERPNVGDDARIYGGPYFLDENGAETRENAFFLSANRNKKSITLNLSKPEGQEIIRELAAQCDVFMENYKVGDLKRYGLDYESLRAINPRLIYCSITGYGQEGPYAKRPGYDAIFQGMSGLMSVTGLPDGAPGAGPMKVGPSIADVLTSLNVTSAIMGALYHRDINGGTGQYLDMALLDSTIAALSHYAQIYLVSGEAPIRRGTQGNGGMPAAMFPTSDGAIMVTAGNDVQYARLCDAIGRPDLLTDPRFHTNSARVANRDELTVVFNAIFGEKPKAYWLDLLDKADIPSGPINNLDEVFADAQVKHRGVEVKVAHPLGSDVSLIRSPIRYSETPLDRYQSPPLLGQHTDEVLESLLGYDDTRRQALRSGGII